MLKMHSHHINYHTVRNTVVKSFNAVTYYQCANLSIYMLMYTLHTGGSTFKGRKRVRGRPPVKGLPQVPNYFLLGVIGHLGLKN